jgi:hypothetical protein
LFERINVQRGCGRKEIRNASSYKATVILP